MNVNTVLVVVATVSEAAANEVRLQLLAHGGCCQIDDKYSETREIILMGVVYPSEVYLQLCLHPGEAHEFIRELDAGEVVRDTGLRYTIVRHTGTGQFWLIPRAAYERSHTRQDIPINWVTC